MGFTLLSLTFVACTGEDYYYKDLIADKDLVHAGKISDLSFTSGERRFALNFNLSKDPKVRDVIIYWNQRQDSLVVPVTENEANMPKEILVNNLVEDTYEIEVFTRNVYQVRSVPTRIVGRVYGDAYRQTINNRAFLEGGFSGGRVWVEWIPETREDYQFTEITYTNINDESVTVDLAKGTEWRYLDNYKRGTPIHFRAAYKPEENCLDLFFSDSDIVIME